ncbi:ArsR/SmtB family transcription factor [Ideonella livida]|uniref:Helix-turn-helix transcriptional regulator n=1 Tax=Ideonella livida TaxID=2707176 RepID=A0A7C9TNI9_9BURK|nr:helix-turn-helix domain-containing protein [Ideonella livida]NDY93903.1 helix-turn-helix transcriptional regulator [Ideonella livida]
MEDQDVIKALAALAQTHRLKAFRALVVAGPAGLTPGVLAERLGIPANTLSFHLKELTHAGLVGATRESRHLIYRVDFTRVQALLATLMADCCAGDGSCMPALAPTLDAASCCGSLT